jgi:cyclopropane-fatty-acyl-phospholipid synthase
MQGLRHSRSRDRQAVTYHYDLSNDFYSLWLDDRMVYSCAYFASPDEDLETAQERKLDYVCGKLRLRGGERLLDIGCGWGGLVLHAATRWRAEALGITLSRPQAELANERIRAAGAADRCRVEVRDYRDVEGPETFDKLVSVGMFEHVGESRLAEYFGRAFRLLRPAGVFLNHGIACHPAFPRFRGRPSRTTTSFRTGS